MVNGAFAASIDGFLPDRHVAHFTITSSCDTNTWSSDFALTLNAPRLTTGQFTIDDATGGNGNGVIDPGETVTISIPTINSGHSTAEATTGRLLVTGEYVTLNNTSSDPGTLNAGESADGVFSIIISPDAPVGSVLELHYIAVSGPYNVLTNLYPVVGSLAEDFETGDFSKFDWQMSGGSNWTITQINPQQGIFSARSGIIGDQQTSALYLSGNVLVNDTISFFCKVSSEPGYDYLKFYIDGQEMQSWSGDLNWIRVKFPVAVGKHAFKWSYEKDSSTKGGEDVAMVDYIVFPAFISSLNADALSFPATICTGGQTQLFGFAFGGTGIYTYAWSPSTGLSDSTIFNPIATPTITTTYSLRVSNMICYASTAATVSVEPISQTPIITQNGTYLESSAAVGNQWYNKAGPITGAIDKTYTPGHTDDYYVIVSTAQGCISEASNSIYLVFKDLKENHPQLVIYPNPFNGKFNISYTLISDSKVKLAIYNALGNEITVISEGKVQPAGQYNIVVEHMEIPAGVYFCKLFTGNEVIVTKMVCTR
jgi:hypothetical protein